MMDNTDYIKEDYASIELLVCYNLTLTLKLVGARNSPFFGPPLTIGKTETCTLRLM